MAYPPAVPPATRVNTTPQADNHPADHNAISGALTDIVNQLGPNPGINHGTVTDSFSMVDLRLDRLESGSNMALQWLGAFGGQQPIAVFTPYDPNNSKPFILAGQQVITTDGAGWLRLPFLTTVTGGIRSWSAHSGDGRAFIGWFSREGFTTDWVTVSAYKVDGTPYRNGAIRVDYTLIGWQNAYPA